MRLNATFSDFESNISGTVQPLLTKCYSFIVPDMMTSLFISTSEQNVTEYKKGGPAGIDT